MRGEDIGQITASKNGEMGKYREVMPRTKTQGWNWVREPVLRWEKLNCN